VTIHYFLVSLGSPIHWNVSAPSFVEKKAPHLGHLMGVFCDAVAHPKTMNSIPKIKTVIHFLISILPMFHSIKF